jgi:4-hydroxybenzoate polyprenyltransferase
MSGVHHAAPARHAGWALLRPPNLLTVPGDPVAGFLLASAAGFSTAAQAAGFDSCGIGLPAWGRAGVAVAAALLIYAHGLIGNDLFDQAEDRRERPDRPIPSGGVRPRTAIMLCLLTAAAGIALSGFNGWASVGTVALLTATVLLYNGVMKRFRILGPLFMGACRALSLLTGAVAAGWRGELSAPVLASAGLLGLYVAAVTAIARSETRATELGFRRWLPALVLVAGFGAVGWAARLTGIETWIFAFALGIPMAIGAGLVGHHLAGRPAPNRVQAAVGQWLRGLLFMQVCLASIGWGGLAAPGVIGLALWACQVRLAKRFYCT